MFVVLSKIGGMLDIEQDELRNFFQGTDRNRVLFPCPRRKLFLLLSYNKQAMELAAILIMPTPCFTKSVRSSVVVNKF